MASVGPAEKDKGLLDTTGLEMEGRRFQCPENTGIDIAATEAMVRQKMTTSSSY